MSSEHVSRPGRRLTCRTPGESAGEIPAARAVNPQRRKTRRMSRDRKKILIRVPVEHRAGGVTSVPIPRSRGRLDEVEGLDARRPRSFLSCNYSSSQESSPYS